MRSLVVILILSTLLFSSSTSNKNPDVYAALGDVIYGNVNSIENLQNLSPYTIYKEKIQNYVQAVKDAKKIGEKIESGDKNVDADEYLATLRNLSKENDFFVRLTNIYYESSIKNEKSELFLDLVNSGLVDTQERKQEILDYYFTHKDDINATGVIQTFLDEDAKLKAKKETQIIYEKSKKNKELEKIERIRQKDQLEQEALEQKLQKELEEKKKKLREEQKIELQKTL